MIRLLSLSFCALLALTASAGAEGISGQYLEARTCDIWTGPCFANAEMYQNGNHAVMGWKVDKGTFDDVKLDGLGIVAIVAASDTLGLDQTGPAKAVLIVDKNATKAQRDALVKFAQKQGGDLLKNVVAVASEAVEIETCHCKEGGCARLEAGAAHIETRCLAENHDKVCGNESAFYPPLITSVKAVPAMASKAGYSGKEFNATWSENDRRGAYIGSFEVR
jgi:hypothetical protein